ncbi:SDR family NAD(P)-dependent oxidoreductase [Ketobacter alkanivorans]|uniref:Acetoin dehydrogenase n=1 Tax=Ketobacter alkanivorans TaxID=1917421 RepID=A0A2K9LH57_9GAMM|nr:SDR family NAD(P)-dependent oxidoreductase [Ketobacter alkanivorans]AUM11567.1 acetoin dehydrogenase [Ketobacter alkanivorans]MCP5015362.1 SDR family NAD(P)-dependent oxidoreductase [Ketobacter sp.]
MKQLQGKVAAITGAGSGIGQALAIELAKLGCELAISDRNEAGLKETEAQVVAVGAKCTSCLLDVAEREAVYAWADQVVAEHGRVNLIFNNAGVALSETVETMSYDNFEWLMNINFWGVVYGTKAFLPYLKQSGSGHVINVSSVFGMIGVPTQSAYNAAKFAVRGFTESLREEMAIEGANVNVTCVHPGGIKTNIVRSSRIGEVGKAGTKDPVKAAKMFDKAARTTPQEAARVIIEGVLKDKARVLIGTDARVIDTMQRLLPTGYQKILIWGAKRNHAKHSQ